jgi:hypothetical protein
MPNAFGMNCDNTFGLMTEMRGADAVQRVCWKGDKNGHGRRERMLPAFCCHEPVAVGCYLNFSNDAVCASPDIKRKRSDRFGVHHGTCLGWETAASFGAELGRKIKRNDGEKVCQEGFPD